ncbi:hypothetical protein E2C01_033596 [Portunus trituberculatus]|uniref:Uncharacterized protein n=1 Tax=Portunus trituberculatus TaxID=210409 RepID=A0A5B7F4M7_PORTR|nr:hypothetical protein [Portunus trituberculatus]
MSSSSDDAEAVFALVLAYRKSQQKRKCLWIRPCLSLAKNNNLPKCHHKYGHILKTYHIAQRL